MNDAAKLKSESYYSNTILSGNINSQSDSNNEGQPILYDRNNSILNMKS